MSGTVSTCSVLKCIAEIISYSDAAGIEAFVFGSVSGSPFSDPFSLSLHVLVHQFICRAMGASRLIEKEGDAQKYAHRDY